MLINSIKKNYAFLIIALLLPILFNVPIYSDEQANWISFYKGMNDALLNNLLPMCKSFWEAKIPSTWIIGRYWIGLTNEYLGSPLSFRIYGTIYFIVVVILYKNLIDTIRKENSTNNIILIFTIGYIAVSTIYLRTESQFLIYLLSSYLIWLKNKDKIFNSYKTTKLIIIYSGILILLTLIMNLHGRAVLLSPIYIYFIYTLSNSRIKYLFLIAAFYVVYESIIFNLKLYRCDDQHIINIFNSVRMDPKILQSPRELIQYVYMKHIEMIELVKNVFFNVFQGATPLPVNSEVEIKGIVKIFKNILIGLFTILVIISILLQFNLIYKKLFKKNIEGDLKLINLGSVTFICTYLNLILLKPTRFYETAIFWPLIIVSIKLNLESLKRERIYFIIHKYIGITLLAASIFSLYIFYGYYGKFLLSGWSGPYVSIQKHNNHNYSNAIKEVMSGENDKDKKLILYDFHTIHHHNSRYPILANFFWWFSEGMSKEYIEPYGKLFILSNINSDGILVRCDSMPKEIIQISKKARIDKSGNEELNNLICYVEKYKIQDIDYEKYFKRNTKNN